MEQNETSLPMLTLADLWDILCRRLFVMLLTATMVTAAIFAINRFAVPPRYQSTATLYILRQAGDQERTSEDFSLALKVVSDCSYLLKSHSVLDAVIDTLELDISYEELRGAVSTANPEGTRILEVTAEADTPAQAKEIVDTICAIGTDKIQDALGFRQVNLYEYGVWEESPCNRIGVSTCVLVFGATAVLVYGLYLVGFLLVGPKTSAKYLPRTK